MLIVCSKTFLLLDDYFKHLQKKSDEKSSSTLLTEICNEIENVSKLIDQKTGELGVFRCVYCKAGYNDIGIYFKSTQSRYF